MRSIEKLTVVDAGGGQGPAKVGQYVTSLLATLPEMVKNVSGFDVAQWIRETVMKGKDSTRFRRNLAGIPAIWRCRGRSSSPPR